MIHTYIYNINETATQSANAGFPDSTLTGVGASIVAALIVYFARQWWEKRKLRRALLTEVKQMEGIEDCAERIGEISEDPSSRPLDPSDVPSPNEIPTVIYESNAGRIGLLGSFLFSGELKEVVEFYSRVLRFKSVIADVKNDEVSDTDQEDLYDEIGSLSSDRDEIIDEDSFN